MNRIKFLYSLVLIWMLAYSVSAQQKVINFQTSPTLENREVQQLIDKYRDIEVSELKALFAAVEPDTTVEKAIGGLPDHWKNISRTVAQVGDPRLWRVGEKVIQLTGSHKYEFIYLENAAPLAVSDSNCLLLITSSMIALTDGNDDGLMGLMIHETAHGIFALRTLQIKKDFNAALKVKDWEKADQLRKDLAMIELECDLIAGKLLVAAKYKLTRYAELQVRLERIENELKIPRSVQWHPEGEIRKQALLGLTKEKAEVAKK